VGVFEVHDGRIAAQRIYYDGMIVVEQLGTPAAPATIG
jgi:limonene-1,2-epoxide hydrolase